MSLVDQIMGLTRTFIPQGNAGMTPQSGPEPMLPMGDWLQGAGAAQAQWGPFGPVLFAIQHGLPQETPTPPPAGAPQPGQTLRVQVTPPPNSPPAPPSPAAPSPASPSAAPAPTPAHDPNGFDWGSVLQDTINLSGSQPLAVGPAFVAGIVNEARRPRTSTPAAVRAPEFAGFNFGTPTSAQRAPVSTPGQPNWVSPIDASRTSGFGSRRPPTAGASSNHPGVDFGGQAGQQVVAAGPGRVVSVGPRRGLGNVIVIDHGNGVRTEYGHLGPVGVTEGQTVAAGTPIGGLAARGTPGNIMTNPNLHFQYMVNGVPHDPTTILGGATRRNGGGGTVIYNGGTVAPFAAPDVATIDPTTAMDMIPRPTPLAHVTLPPAPQQEMPAPQPHAPTLDREEMMRQMTEALRFDHRDRSHDKWDRISAMLAQAASAAAGAGPDAGLGRTIGAAGAAANQGFTSERQRQEALNQSESDREQQVRLALAQFGFGIDDRNRTITDLNAVRDWTSGENVRRTRFENLGAADQRTLQTIEANLRIDTQNNADLNAYGANRANIGLGAMQTNVAAQNTAAQAAQNTALAAYQIQQRDQELHGGMAGFTERLQGMLAAVGVNPADPNSAHAVSAAAAIASGNVSMAMRQFAAEIWTNAPDVRGLPRELGLTSTELSQLTAAQRAQDENTILSILTNALSRSGAADRLVSAYAARGTPIATMILQNRQPAPAAPITTGPGSLAVGAR